ncbi:unnamed protein product [Cunninghamella echinulata]
MHILDIGCGSGLWTQKIKENIPLSTIQAIDISETQIQLAKKNVPLLSDAFQCQDIMSFSNKNHSFDVIVGLFSFIHLSQEDQLLIFPKLYQWLNPNGLILINLSPFEHPCLINQNWLGAEMFWSSLGEDKYKQLIEQLGFTILEWSIVEEQEDDVRIPFLWIICQKKKKLKRKKKMTKIKKKDAHNNNKKLALFIY